VLLFEKWKVTQEGNIHLEKHMVFSPYKVYAIVDRDFGERLAALEPLRARGCSTDRYAVGAVNDK
jgi:hypothetical protein